MADHLDDGRGGADDRLDRPRGDQDVEQGQSGLRARLIEAQYVDAGEDQQAGQRHDQGGRDPAGEMVERRHLARSAWAWAEDSGAEHILEGLADDQRHGRDLARDLEQAGRGGAARARKHQVEDHRRRIDQRAAGEIGRQSGTKPATSRSRTSARGSGARSEQLEIVIAAEQRHAEQGGHRQRAEVGDHQADIGRAEHEEADGEDDAARSAPRRCAGGSPDRRRGGRGRPRSRPR